jgi:signal transduction histidine kinase/ABC-type nitrate/sulfonate/bicarbonate transport system substrate-binding protein
VIKKFVLLYLFSLSLLGYDNISVQLDWKHQFEYAGYYIAKEKGFYKEAGFEVDIREFSGTNPVDTVINGESQFGVYNSKIVLEKMNGTPLVLLGNFFKKSALVFVAQKEIRTPNDFFGKKIMAGALELHSDGLGALLHRFNITKDDYTWIPHTFHSEDFIDKKVDVMTAFISNETFKLKEAGVEFNIIDPANYGIYMYGDNLFSSAKYVEQNPDRAKKFLDATVRGWSYALKNIEETVDLILERYNSSLHKSREALLFEAEATKNMMMPNTFPIGSVKKETLDHITSTFIELGLAGTEYSLRGFLLEEYLNKNIELTSEEREYLNNLKEITMCVDPDWMPYEKITEDGKHIGMSADYLKLVEDVLKVPFRLVPTENWSDSLKFVKDGKCDVLSLAMETESRKSFLNFTDEYFSFPLVIATRSDELFVVDIEDVFHKKVGIVKDYAFVEIFKKRYSNNIELVEVHSVKEGLELVNSGKLFGFIGTLPTVGYIIQREYLNRLKIGGKFKDNWKLGIAVRKDLPTLVSILNKSILSIPPIENQQIMNRWISVKYEEGINRELIIGIILTFLVIIASIAVKYFLTQRYNAILKKEIAENLEELRKKDIALVHQNKLASMGEMVGSIAHQWKQPLNVLHLNIEMLPDDYEDGLIDEDFIEDFRAKNVDIIRFMTNTIDDFRNFFRVEKEKSNFHIKEAIEKIIEMQKIYLKKRNVDISVTGDDFIVFGFRTEFQQVILNLINNSKDEIVKKEMKNGLVKIEVEAGKVSVKDNAGGVPEGVIDKIFKPYFTTKDVGEGTGIGLHMSKMIIEDHLDGEIWVRNIEGGAEFIIELKEVAEN